MEIKRDLYLEQLIRKQHNEYLIYLFAQDFSVKCLI